MAIQNISKTDLAFNALNNYEYEFSLSYIRKILNGEANPTIKCLFNLSEKLNINIADLLREGEIYDKQK